MATREAIVDAIRGADARGEALRERIVAAPEASLPAGEWRVRDAISHLAARANPLPLIEAVRTLSEAGGEAPAFDVDAQNATQIAERAEKSAADILDEMHTSYADAIAGIEALDEEALTQSVKLPMTPNEIAMSDLLLMSMGMHVEAHLSEIEAALDQASG